MRHLRLTIGAIAVICSTWNIFGAAMTTLTNFNAVYFLVDPAPAAIPTNVVLLSGNLTNWQKLTTNSMPVGANPTAAVGLTAINGSSANFMRADAAPRINTSITPTWLSYHTWRNNSLGQAIGLNDGLTLVNQSAATALLSQFSPSLKLDGYGWDQDTAASVNSRWFLVNRTGSATNGGFHRFEIGRTYGANLYATVFQIDKNSGYTGTGTNVLADDGFYKSFSSFLSINPTNDYLPVRSNATTFVDSPLYRVALTNTATDGMLVFGPGTTNVLYRDGVTLRYGAYWPTPATIGINAEHASGDALSLLSGTTRVATFWDSTVTLPSAGGVQFMASGDTYTGSGGVALRNEGNGIVSLNQFAAATTLRVYSYTNVSTGGYSRLSINQATTNDVYVINLESSGDAGPSRSLEVRSNGVTVAKVDANSGYSGAGTKLLADAGKYIAAGTWPQQYKSSFSTNFTCTTNVQFYLLNGTNQLITLPTAASANGVIYRFSMTNGYGSFIITNAADGARIRDGTSLSYTNIGINELGLMSDGSHWWLASKAKTIFPSASWSLTNTITPVQDVITNIPFTTLEFNNSQGISLTTNGWGTFTHLNVTNAGTYLITFSAVLKGSAGGSKISVWLRRDGADVARTRTDQAFSGATAQQCMTVNYFVAVGTTPSYFELVAASHDLTPPTIESAPVNPTGFIAPAMPGIIVTINRVSDSWP